jgi:hypothetical protein
MEFLTIGIIIVLGGLIGIALRKNLLGILVSFFQVAVGINGLLAYYTSSQEHFFLFYLVFFLIFIFIIFFCAIAMLLIKRRSTLNVNELTELRG